MNKTIVILLLSITLTSSGAGTLPFGAIAVSLGKPVASVPSIDDVYANKVQGLVLDKFYHIGGLDAKIVATDARIFYDEKSLYLFFRCDNPNPNTGLEPRDDKMAVYISMNNDPVKYYEFYIRLKNNVTEGKYFTKENDTTSQRIVIPKADVRTNNDKILGKLEIPWSAIGGKPAGTFGMLVIRHKQQNSINHIYTQESNQTAELSSPTALDFYDPNKPGYYMETAFGTAPSVIRAEGKMLAKLPSGKLFWQKNAVLSMPDEAERTAIWNMQLDLLKPTTAENIASRIQSVQRWTDMMILEGYGFASFIGIWDPSGENYYPWDARRAVNIALANDNMTEACRVMDVFLKRMDQHSRKWFADGSPGDIRKEEWTSVDKLNKVSIVNNSIIAECSGSGITIPLTITASKAGGFRIHASQKGFYEPESIAFTDVKESETGITAKNGDALVVITKGDNWSVVFKESVSGVAKYSFTKADLSLRAKEGRILAVDYSGRLAQDEAIIGFGERFDAVNQRGRILTLWDIDAWEATFKGAFNQMYKIVPLIHSSKGYSVYLNNSYRTRCDVGCSNPERFRYTSHGPVFDVLVFVAKPIQSIKAINEITGKPILPPKWAYEAWMGGGGDRWMGGPLKDATQEMIQVADKFKKLDIPHSAIYAEGSGNEDPLLHATLMPEGVRILSWWSPWIVGLERGRELMKLPDSELPYVRNANGEIIKYPAEYKELHDRNPHIDFFHPKAMDLMRADWKHRFDLGVAGTMVDFADLIQDESVFYNGKRGDEMHNIYCLEYAHKVHEMFKERRGDDHVLYSRAAFSGSQAFVCQFAGDHQSNFYGLTAAIKGNLTMSAVGFSNIGVDAGGYIGRCDQETYMRWVEYSTFSPIMRFHGTYPREPWEYNDSTVRFYKKMVWLRENLLDYIYSNAVNTNLSGIPMTRTLQVMYPEKKEYNSCDDEYFFGPDLLVAPIHDYGNSREVFFPEGTWTNIWTNKNISGAFKQAVTIPADRIAVYLRAGALIPACLNQSLTFGESMTNNKVPVLLATPPATQTTSVCYPEKDQKVTYTSSPAATGFIVSTDGRPDTRYLIIYGTSKKITSVKLDNEVIPMLKDAQLKSLPLGWFEDKQGRIVVRLSYKNKHLIEVNY